MTDMIIPPQNIEAEQAVLGSIMLISSHDDAPERIDKLCGLIRPETFYQRAHQLIFEKLRDLHQKQQPLDLITLTEAFESDGTLEQVGSFAYLAELSKNTPSSANMFAYAAIIRDKAVERFAIQQLTRGIEMIQAQNSLTTQQKLDGIASLMTSVSDRAKTGRRAGLRPFADWVEEWLPKFEARLDPNAKPRGLSSGIGSLDDLLGPRLLVRGALLVIGARPKMGKTTILTQMAVSCATVSDEPALMFSMEMPGDQMVEKITAQKAGISSNIFHPDIRKDDFGYAGDWDNDMARVNAVMGGICDTKNIYMDADPSASLAHICSEARRKKRELGDVGMVLVDYLTLMTPEQADRNDIAYGLITKGLKILAKELDCVVVLLTQLNRGLEGRADKRPKPSDSKDTGQIEQDCDYWIGIHNEGKDDLDVPDDEIELLLRLNRHGDTGVIYCKQKKGVLIDCIQEDERQRRQSREKPKKGGGLRKYSD